MGFFDYLMKGMGFETDSMSVTQVKKKKDKQTSTTLNNSSNVTDEIENVPYNFAFPSYNPSIEENDAENVQISTMQNGVANAKNVIVYKPKNQGDIKNLIDFLRRKEPIIVNFSLLPKDVSASMIAFISGALYALRGSIHPIANNLYLLTPEGVSILVPKDQAPKY